MKQPIAGVNPPELREVTVMTVWPSVAAHPVGKLLGQWYAWDQPGVYIFRPGHLVALLSIPVALVLYFMRVAPYIGTRYTLTNRRVIVQKGLKAVDGKSVDLDRFDAIRVEVQAGQSWYHAGNLVFTLNDEETFRLEGVSRPESFRQACLKAYLSHSGVKKALARQDQRAAATAAAAAT